MGRNKTQKKKYGGSLKDRASRFESEIFKMQQEIEKKKLKKDYLQEELFEKEQQIMDFNQKIDAIKEKIKGLEKGNMKFNQEIDAIRKNIESLKGKIAKHRIRKEEHLNEMQDEIDKSEKKLQQYLGELTDHDKKRIMDIIPQKTKEREESIRKVFETKREKQQARIGELHEEIQEQNQKIGQIQKKIRQEEEQIRQEEDKIKQEEKEIRKEGIKISVIEGEIQNIEKEIKQKDLEIGRLIMLKQKQANTRQPTYKDNPPPPVKIPPPEPFMKGSLLEEDEIPEIREQPPREKRQTVRNQPNLTIKTKPIKEDEMAAPKYETKVKPVPANLQAMKDQKEKTGENIESYYQGMMRSVRNFMPQPQRGTRKTVPK
jgi:predicted  nucleic acid-binding Zn-ribbon protein